VARDSDSELDFLDFRVRSDTGTDAGRASLQVEVELSVFRFKLDSEVKHRRGTCFGDYGRAPGPGKIQLDNDAGPRRTESVGRSVLSEVVLFQARGRTRPSDSDSTIQAARPGGTQTQ
jgi:hypothetical protein